MPAVDNWLNKPIDIVQNIYDKYGQDSEKHIREYFEMKINDPTCLSMVPSLNDVSLHDLGVNCLVRYRCMIQDMFDPEFYLGAYLIVSKHDGSTTMACGKYQDITHCPTECELDLDSEKNVTGDRLTLYCVPIPGENAWTKHAHKEHGCYRRADHSVPTTISPCKRDRDSCHGDAGETVDGTTDAPGELCGKRVCSEQHPRSAPQVSSSKTATDLSFPLPDEKGYPCLVKVYDRTDSYKVNDIVEFVGVYSADPLLAQFPDDDTMQTDDYVDPVATAFPEETRAKSPPSSLVPRLHAILSRPLKHNNPLISENLDLDSIKLLAARTRQKLLDILKHALFDDELSAAYLLCNLLSSVYSRVDVMPLGKFCINLINAPRTAQYARLLQHVIASLTPQSHLLELSLVTMNHAPFSPHKDYTTGRLRSGVLQLSGGTHLMLDETALQPGQLDVTGVKNISALGTLIKWQKVEYDFSYHRQDFLSDVAIVILSEGTSLLPADYRVPLAPQCDPADLTQYFSDLDRLLTPDTLNDIRRYITVTRSLDFAMDNNVQQAVQNDFVDARKHDADNMTVDDFHSLLNLVRLLSLSEGEGEGSTELWVRARSMETDRKQRELLLPRSSSS